MIALTFNIYLKEPLLATGIEGDPNSSVSQPFIPGSMLRGAVIARYLAQNDVPDLANDNQARALFFNGQTRYLSAYPADEHERRTLPTPLSWKREKGTTEPIFDFSVEPDTGEWQPKPINKPFCYLSQGDVTLYEPQKRVNIHTQRDRKMGRATEASGAVFRYEALAPEQTFVGVILCPDNDTTDVIEPLLQQGTLLLGGSQNAGYGLVEIRQVERVENWVEAPGAEPLKAKAFTVTLLSDAVLRDADGQYTGFLTPEILGSYLEVDLKLDGARTHTKTDYVGGFNRKWGLPLPQTPVARAGSVFTFRTEADIPNDRMSALLAVGLGERRAEGFGRFAVNWHVQFPELKVLAPGDRKLPRKPSALSDESAKLATQMAEHMLRNQLDTQLQKQVLSLRITGNIKNTQLSAVRTLVRNALPIHDTDSILDHFKQMKPVGREQFEKARIDSKSLDGWLHDVLSESRQETWSRLHNTSFNIEKLPAVGGVRAEWNDTLAREYALRLIDGVLSQELAERRKEA